MLNKTGNRTFLDRYAEGLVSYQSYSSTELTNPGIEMLAERDVYVIQSVLK